MNDKITLYKNDLVYECDSHYRQFIFTWRCSEIRNVRVENIDGQGGWLMDHTVIEDGRLGRCVLNVKSPLNETAAQKKAEITVTFTADNDYRQTIVASATQRTKAESGNHILFRQYDIFTPFFLDPVEIPYELKGDTIAEVTAPQGSGVYPSEQGGSISIMVVFDGIITPTQRERVVPVTVKGGSGKTYELDIHILLPFLSPVWKDMDASVVTDRRNADYAIYGLSDGLSKDEQPLYKGKVYRQPYGDRLVVNMNKICENYLGQKVDLDYRNSLNKQSDYGRPFALYIDGQYINCFVFYNDWSYDLKKQRLYRFPQVVSEPMDRKIVRGQTFMASVWVPEANPKNDLDHPNQLFKYSLDGKDFTPVEGYERIYLYPWQYMVVTYPTESLPEGTKQIMVANLTYDIINCNRADYVLHYLDSYGGYSSYPILGNVNRYSKAVPYEMNRAFSNTTADFEKRKYLNDIEDRYEITLPLLSREEADRIDEITQSTELWLERLDDHSIVPVVADGADTDFKSSRKVRNYTITLVKSQSRLRK